MKKIIILLSIPVSLMLIQCKHMKSRNEGISNIPDITTEKAIKEIKKLHPGCNEDLLSQGVKQAAALWSEKEGNAEEFIEFCKANYISDDSSKKVLFDKLSAYFESLYGNLNKLSIDLKKTLLIDSGTVEPIDEIFGGYDPYAHINNDFFENKIAFITILNFPFYTLKEKTELGKKWNELEWAYARMGDIFTSRVPSGLLLKFSEVTTNADNYISSYNVYMGNLIDKSGNKLFPAEMKLISHWGLRDELKSNYNAENGLEKQKIIYEVMQRIITQEIPENVINNNEFTWNPYKNKVFKDHKEITFTAEPDTRYKHLLTIFKSLKAIDNYSPNYPTYIQRKFEQEMEMPVDEVEKLFIEFISSPVVKQVAGLISQRLGRPLQPFDIWYDGFKARSSVSQENLDKLVKTKYPAKEAFEKDLPVILTKLGFDKKTATFISSMIAVDAARGAGHAWGAMMRSEKARLRTRVSANGMDYKGYNIASHEFGHNVEQNISLHLVKYYMMNGVPNTAFTEALAFVFQKRDLELLGIKDNNPDKKNLMALDVFWGAYEIMGVSLVDINVWKWMYKNPEATPAELKTAVLNISKEIWNKYYADIFGVKDQYILAIYSHMIDSPLYLSNYPLGHIIEFQIEDQIENKNFAEEIIRMYSSGRLIPQIWMKHSVNSEISPKPLVKSALEATNKLKSKN